MENNKLIGLTLKIYFQIELLQCVNQSIKDSKKNEQVVRITFGLYLKMIFYYNIPVKIEIVMEKLIGKTDNLFFLT